MPAPPEVISFDTYADDDGQVPVTRDVVSCGVVGTLNPWDAASYARDLLIAAHAAANSAALHGTPGWKPCQYCGAPMLWALTDAGKRIPLNPGADPAGNVAVRFADGEVGAAHARTLKAGERLEVGEQRCTTHFSDCPKADQARKPRAARH